MTEKVVKNIKTPVRSEQPKTKVAKKTTSKSEAQMAKGVSVDVYGVDGKILRQQTLPEAIFGQKVNSALIAQAVRVYLANQRLGTASTKSRGEVTGSTRKIYRQKGTGRARHGANTAPLFVGGGVTHGPTPRDFSLTMPQKMKQKALASVLSAKVKDGEVTLVDGLGSLEPKTKHMLQALHSLALRAKGKEPNVLMIITDGTTITRSARNIKNVALTSANRLNVYDVLTTKQVIFTQEALEALEKRFSK